MSYSPYLNHTSTLRNHSIRAEPPEYLKYRRRFMDETSKSQLVREEKQATYHISSLNIISAGLCIAAFGVGIAWFGWPDRMSMMLDNMKVLKASTTSQTQAQLETQPKAIKIDEGFYSADLNGKSFLIPGANLRQIHRDDAGNARRIDILTSLKTNTPKPLTPKAAILDTAAIDKNKIYISLSHIAATTTPETRLETTYKHHLADDGVATSLGLTLYRFKDNSGFGDQELYTGTLPDGPYVSVCFDELAGLNASRCLSSTHIGTNLVARYSFDRTHLKDWAAINVKISETVANMKVSE